MVFALKNELQAFRPINPEWATYHEAGSGPSFYHALVLTGETMNEENSGICNTMGMEFDYGEYDVPADHQQRSLLTGSSYIDSICWKRFTCVELEVFALE